MKDIDSSLDLNAVVPKRTRGGRSPVPLSLEKQSGKGHSKDIPVEKDRSGGTNTDSNSSDSKNRRVRKGDGSRIIHRSQSRSKRPGGRESSPALNTRNKAMPSGGSEADASTSRPAGSDPRRDPSHSRHMEPVVASLSPSGRAFQKFPADGGVPAMAKRRTTRHRPRQGVAQFVEEDDKIGGPSNGFIGLDGLMSDKMTDTASGDGNVDHDRLPSTGWKSSSRVSSERARGVIDMHRKCPAGTPGGVPIVDVTDLSVSSNDTSKDHSDDPNSVEYLHSMWEFALVCHLCCLLRQDPVRVPDFSADELSRALVSTPLPMSPLAHSKIRDGDTRGAATTVLSYQMEPLLCAILFRLCPDAVAANANAAAAGGKTIDVTTFGSTAVSLSILRQRLNDCWRRYFSANPLDEFGIEDLSAKGRCLLLRALCEQRISDVDVFDGNVRDEDAKGLASGQRVRVGSLFVAPLGRDSDGNEFWQMSDDCWLYCLFPSNSSDAIADETDDWRQPARILDIQRMRHFDESRKWMMTSNSMAQLEQFIQTLSKSDLECERYLCESLRMLVPLLPSQERQRRLGQGGQRSLRQQLAGFQKLEQEKAGKEIASKKQSGTHGVTAGGRHRDLHRLRNENGGSDASEVKSKHFERLCRQAEEAGAGFDAADVKNEIEMYHRKISDVNTAGSRAIVDSEVHSSMEKQSDKGALGKDSNRRTSGPPGEVKSNMACICGVNNYEGLMVQCERCLFWLHATCLNFHSESDIPDGYCCHKCVTSGKRMIKHPEPLAVGVQLSQRGSKRDLKQSSVPGNMPGQTDVEPAKKRLKTGSNNVDGKGGGSDQRRNSNTRPMSENGQHARNDESDIDSSNSGESSVDDTKCICEEAVHSELMIECDKCNKWSHSECYGWFKSGKTPKKFLCHLCGGPGVQLDKLNPKDRARVLSRERDRKRRLKDLAGKGRTSLTIKSSVQDQGNAGPTFPRKSVQSMEATSKKSRDDPGNRGGREVESAVAALLAPADDGDDIRSVDRNDPRRRKGRPDVGLTPTTTLFERRGGLSDRDHFNFLLDAADGESSSDSEYDDITIVAEDVYIDPFNPCGEQSPLLKAAERCQQLFSGTLSLASLDSQPSGPPSKNDGVARRPAGVPAAVSDQWQVNPPNTIVSTSPLPQMPGPLVIPVLGHVGMNSDNVLGMVIGDPLCQSGEIAFPVASLGTGNASVNLAGTASAGWMANMYQPVAHLRAEQFHGQQWEFASNHGLQSCVDLDGTAAISTHGSPGAAPLPICRLELPPSPAGLHPPVDGGHSRPSRGIRFRGFALASARLLRLLQTVRGGHA